MFANIFKKDINKQLKSLIKSYAKDKKILLADDNPSDIEFYKVMFGKMFLECDTASNGEEAYEKFMAKGKGYYDLVVTDVEMPKMNGLELVKLIRDVSLKQNIIVLTGIEDLRTNQDISFYHVDGILPKPIDKKKLYTGLYKVLKRISYEKNFMLYVEEIEKDTLHIEKTIMSLQIAIEMLSRAERSGKTAEVLRILHGMLSSNKEYVDKKYDLRKEVVEDEKDLLEDSFLISEESSIKKELKKMYSGSYLNAEEFGKMQKIDKALLDDILELFTDLEEKENYLFGLTKDYVVMLRNIVEKILKFINQGHEFEKLVRGLDKLLFVLSSIEKDLGKHQALKYQLNEIVKSLKVMIDSLFVRKNSNNIHEFDDEILKNIAQIEILLEEEM